MGDKQEMDVEVDAQGLLEVGERLSKLPSSKDTLCKLLKQALALLSAMSQSIDISLQSAMEPLKTALGKSNLLKHKDKDVRLLVAACISEVMRIVAPDAPYDDDTLKDVFELIVASFKGLNEKSSPHFERRVNILEAVANFRSAVVMLDIDCHHLIREMFHIFFTTVSEEPKFVMMYMKTIMCLVLEESEEIPDRLLELLLGNLLRGKKGVSNSGNTLARAVVEQCADQLGPYVEAFLTSIMSEGKSSKSRWRESYHDLIFEIYTCAPSLLVPSISKLTDELLTDELDVRVKAVKLLGRMFASQQGVPDVFEQLFVEYVKRFTDKAVEVRLAMVECAKQCLLANPSGPRARQFLNALSDRLQDFDNGVRLHVVLAICDFAESNPEFTLVDELKRVAERLRDTEAIVRRETLKRLTDLYRSFCLKKVESLPVNTESFYWIPSKLIRCCFDRDSKEFRAQGMELVFSEQLFPSGFPVQERVKCWIAFFSAFDSNDVKALERILQQKQRLHSEMRNFLSQKKLKDEESQEDETKLLPFCKSMASFFADPSNAEIQLQKLVQLKDSKLRKDLSTLLDSSIPLAQSLSIRTNLLNRLGEKHPQYEFLKVLAVKCSYVLFGKEHMHSLLAELKDLRRLEDENQLRASMGLLVAFANHFPALLDGVEGDVMELLKDDKDFLKEGAVEVLAKVGGSMRGRFIEESNSIDLLEKLCIDGSRKQAKYAVQALAAMSNDFGSKVFSGLYRKLLDLLESDVKLPTILQSLGCIAQHAMSVFETHEEDLVNFLVRDLFTRDDLQASSDGDDTEHHSMGAATQLKIFGLKTLVRSFLPNKDSQQVQRLKGLLGILLKFLELGEIRDDVKSSGMNKAYLRLAAAKGVLRLSRRYDAQISAKLFQATVLCAKDPFIFVKRQFVGKVQKLLKERHLPQKYACALALSIGVTDDDFLAEAKQQLCDFIELSRRQARFREPFGAGPFDASYFPEYVLFFLVHILAQEAEFPKISEGGPTIGDVELCFKQLSLFIWALLNHDRDCIPNDEIRKAELDKVALIFGVFCAMKDAEDNVDASKTENTYILSEIGIAIAKKLVGVEHLSSDDIPTIPLPKPIYKSFDGTIKLEGSYVPAFLTNDETFSQMFPSGIDVVVSLQKGKADHVLQKRKADHVENGCLEKDEKLVKKRNKVTESSGKEEEPVQKRNKSIELSGKEEKLARKGNKMTELSGKEKPVQKRKSMTDISAKEEKPAQKRNKVTESSKINEQQETKLSPKLPGASERQQASGHKRSQKEKSAKLEIAEKPEKLDTKASSPKQKTEDHLLKDDEDETLSSVIHKCGKRKRTGEADVDFKQEVNLAKLSRPKVTSHDMEEAAPEAVDRHDTAPEAVASHDTHISASEAVLSHDSEVPAPDAVATHDTEVTAHDAEGSSVRRHVRISIKKPKPPLETADNSLEEEDRIKKGLGKKVLDGKHRDATVDAEAQVRGTISSRGRPRKPSTNIHGSGLESRPKSRVDKKEQALGEEMLHHKIRVWWPLDKRFYQGTIRAYNADKMLHDVVYDDGDKETLNLKKERWELVENQELDTPESPSIQRTAKHGLKIKTKEGTLETKRNLKEKSTKSRSHKKVKPEVSTVTSKPIKAEVSNPLDANEESGLLDGGRKADGNKQKPTPVSKRQSITPKHDKKSLPEGLKSDDETHKGSPSSTASKDSENSDDLPLNTWTSPKKKGH